MLERLPTAGGGGGEILASPSLLPSKLPLANTSQKSADTEISANPFSPLQGLAFHPDGIFSYEDIILMQSIVAVFPFIVSTLNVLLKKIFPSQDHKEVLM